MKILFIHNQYTQRGGEDVALDLETKLLQEKGHDIKKLVFTNDSIAGGAVSKIRSAFNAVYNFNAFKETEKLIKDFKPDIIHVHNLFFVASPSVLFAAAKFKIPVVLTIHNYRLVCANALLLRDGQVCELCIGKTLPLDGIKYKCYHNSSAQSALVTTITSFHKLVKTWQQKVSAYIVLTNFAKAKLTSSSLQIDENKLIVKPNFIEDPGSGTWPREDYFVFVGRISEEKGIHILLEAFANLPAQKIFIIGDGPQKQLLQQQYLSHSNISFEGSLDKPAVLSILQKSKALIFPSIWYEGLPFTIVEAFATGTPVIASKLGAMTDLVTHGYNGFHFTAGSVKALQEAIESFDSSEQLYLNARETYINKYHPDIHYSSILKIYKEAGRK
jgi:glycosyltransferase involved in cell wall biosynthesis